MENIFRAVTFAAKAHENQKRRYHGIPYINHLLRVGEKAVRAKLSEDAIIAAFLHDTIEDTKVTEADLLRHFSPRSVTLVKLLTKWWPDHAKGKEIDDFKKKYYLHISEDQDALHLKLLDRADNLADFATSLPESTKEAEKYVLETAAYFPPLLTKCSNSIVRSIFDEALDGLESAL